MIIIIQNNHPVISDDTMKEMTKFFMKTSIPRILIALERGELVMENRNLVTRKEVKNT